MLIIYTPIRNIGSFPINKGNFFVPAAPAWNKINKKTGFTCFWRHISSKKCLIQRTQTVLLCAGIFESVQKLDLVCFVKPAFDQIWPEKTKGWTNKHDFKANNHHDAKKLGELSQQPPFNNPSIWREISKQILYHTELLFWVLLYNRGPQGLPVKSWIQRRWGWPRLWAAAMLPDQPSHHCVHSSPLATKVSSIVMVDHYLTCHFSWSRAINYGYSNGLYLSKGSVCSHLLLMPIACDAVLILETIILSCITCKIDIMMFQTQLPYCARIISM